MKIEWLANTWKAHVGSEWFPWWHNGATTVQYYPPISLWFYAFVQMQTGDVNLTYKLIAVSCVFLGAISAFHLGRRLGLPSGGAIIGASLYISAPYTLTTVLRDGTPGRILSLPLYPLLFLVLSEAIKSPRWGTYSRAVILSTLLILVHAMHAYMLAIAIGIYLTVKITMEQQFQSIFRLAAIAGNALMIAGFWWVPGATQWEIPGVPGTYTVHVLRLGELPLNNMQVSQIGLVYMALSSFFAVGFLLFQRADSTKVALSASYLITMTLTLGYRSPLFSLVPLGSALSPIRFVNAAYLPAGLVVAFGLEWVAGMYRRRNFARTLLFGLVIFLMINESTPFWVIAPRRQDELFDTLLSDLHVTHSPFSNGRVVNTVADFDSCSWFHFPRLGLLMTEGHNWEGTPHLATYTSINIAHRDGFDDYLLRTWKLWNTRYILLREDNVSLRQALARDDWKLLASHVAGVMLMHNDTPSSYIYKLEPKILVIGRSTPYVTRLFTGVTEGKQPNPLAYSPSYLAQFPVIYLYDLPYLDAGVLEHFIRQRLSNGSTVIVDLSATQISELFGVLREDVPMEGDARLRQFTGYRTNDVALSLKSGPGASYDGLDTIYASVLVENAHYAIMGEKRLSEGTVLFTGLHLPRLIVEHDTDDLRDFMISTLPASSLLSAVSGTPRFPEAFKADTIEWSNQGLSFTYSSERDTLVGISVTYSPRWSLSIDGDQTQALNYENLISILLPKGSHKVDMKYVARTGATLAGWAVTAAGLGMYLLTYQWRRRSLSFGTPKPVSRDGVTLAR